jgi:hypothetical protein
LEPPNCAVIARTTIGFNATGDKLRTQELTQQRIARRASEK